jgi:myo-inositol 2-dehydrogenase/D-chiro-inositol 1-dehydrogenase
MHEQWGYIEEDRLFVDALDGKSPVPVSAEDGYQVVQLIEACYQSARDQSRVHLSALVGKV